MSRADPNAALVGIGTIGYGKFGDMSLSAMYNAALEAALEDCGLQRSQIDGVLVQIGTPRGLDYDVVASQLALNTRFGSQTWAHGRWHVATLAHAAMAVNFGLCDYAVCFGAFRNTIWGHHGTSTYPESHEGVREGGGPHSETPHAGMEAPMSGAAMALTRYLDHYGVDREKLGAVPVAQRKWARLNPLAALRAPMTMEDYLNCRYVVEPIRLFDSSFPVDLATAAIITTSERAKDAKSRPIYLRAIEGVHAGPNEFCFGRPGLGHHQADIFELEDIGGFDDIYTNCGIGRSDVGAFYCYDGFSPQTIYTLERFGFCKGGEGFDFVQDGRIEKGGVLPVNTSGGHLSEGHTNGWGALYEIVQQLRGNAGERQIEGLHFAQWATTLGDTIIYGR